MPPPPAAAAAAMKPALKYDSAFGSVHDHDDDDMPGSIEFDEVSSSDGLPDGASAFDGQTSVIKQISRIETRRIRIFRAAVFASSAVAVGMLSWLGLSCIKQQKIAVFRSKYETSVDALSQTLEARIGDLKLAMGNIADIVAASASTSPSGFPFVTVPMFELHAKHIRMYAQLESLVYGPLVFDDQLALWNNYSVENQGWLGESDIGTLPNDVISTTTSTLITPFIFENQQNDTRIPSQGPEPYSPCWQLTPFPGNGLIPLNLDILRLPDLEARKVYLRVIDSRQPEISHMINPTEENDSPLPGMTADSTYSYICQPVSSTEGDAAVSGLLFGVVDWDSYLGSLLPAGNVGGYSFILRNTCNQTHSYIVRNGKATSLGAGDFHDCEWDDYQRTIPLNEFLVDSFFGVASSCLYFVDVYPTDIYWDENVASDLSVGLIAAVALSFTAVIVFFILYDVHVRDVNNRLVRDAMKSNELISSLFPSNVRERVMAERVRHERRVKSRRRPSATIQSLGGFLMDQESVYTEDDEEDGEPARFANPPIADLFPEATVLFADISGFTAWSSSRQPSDVFVLLETLYRSFDSIAKRRKIWKVETIGDCYVAVAGVPDVRHDHAVAMTRFARDCLYKTRSLTKRLEMSLGPGTASLAMRMGIHSGPVTAGVLRGERSRFQLFGDTMNTASRIETTGERDRIQISEETAQLLVEAGKSRWLVPRKEKVFAKGKGEIRTFWFVQSLPKQERQEIESSIGYESSDDTSFTSESTASFGAGPTAGDRELPKKMLRLIDWNTDLLLRFLNSVVKQRLSKDSKEKSDVVASSGSKDDSHLVLEEVSECFTFPSAHEVQKACDEVGDDIRATLHDFVEKIALLYRPNPFHNFEHASHVCMSVVKLLSRIVKAPTSDFGASKSEMNGISIAETMHQQTFGLSSDPLTQFAAIFSAMVHAVGHTGSSNLELSEQSSDLTKSYGAVSTIQQHSATLAWNLLQEDVFAPLLNTICVTDGEKLRFRQIVVSLVVATDLEDDEQRNRRATRWLEAFPEGLEATAPYTPHQCNLRGTLCIEYIVRASTIAHTMQHWHVFYKWSSALLRERTDALSSQKEKPDWYKEQLQFFDAFVLPIARKLGSGVFGVAGTQYLTYAITNQAEWKEKGLKLVAEMNEQIGQ